MKDELAWKFINAINRVSYFNAAEGVMWSIERAEAEKARDILRQLKSEMIAVYGVEKTKSIIDSMAHLCYQELELEA